MKRDNAKKILSDLESGYDLIAEKFSGTRAFMWRDLGFIKDMVKPGYRVLDFGCGNGRLAGFLENKYREFVGVDISQKLIDIAKQRYNNEKTKFIKIGHTRSAHFYVASSSARRRIQKIRLTSRFTRALNCTQTHKSDKNNATDALPFEDNHFDVVFSIAVFHHFPSQEYALEIVRELRRVLKSDGKIVITVWNLWQKQYQRFDLKNLKRSNLGKKSGWEGFYIPFKSGKKTFQRYHHPFKMGELEDLFKKSSFKTLRKKEGWNLVYIGEKNNPERV